MPLDLTNYETKTKAAVKAFWKGRQAASAKQIGGGKADQGERSAVTGGKNMDGFISLMRDLVRVNGLKSAEIQLGRQTLTLPGYFRPTKLWDLLIMDRGRLIAALEFKVSLRQACEGAEIWLKRAPARISADWLRWIRVVRDLKPGMRAQRHSPGTGSLAPGRPKDV